VSAVGQVVYSYGPGDPYDANVILRMHFDGNYTDFSRLAQALTNTGGTESTTNAKFDQSVDMNGSNTSTSTNIILSNTAISQNDILNSDMTMEAFVRVGSAMTAGGSTRPIVATCNSSGSGTGGGGHVMGIRGDGGGGGTTLVYAFDGSGAADTASVSAFITTNTWTHVAISRIGGTTSTKFFIDGVLVKTQNVAAGSGSGAANKRIAVGNFWGLSQAPDAKFDEVRVTSGVARYSATFTVPTSAYPDR
jgi:hypothetical protein